MATPAVHTLYDEAPHRDEVDRKLDGYAEYYRRVEPDSRKSGYADMTNAFYDLVTEFYEHGWGQSFHFPTLRRGDPLSAGIKAYEHYLALKLGLRPGMRVLDVGCGVGGPMREIAHFSGAHVTGFNNNPYQIERSRKHTAQARLEHLCDHVQGDFMHMPIADGTFDAVYAIEATCHAPDKVGCYAEILRVLRPGGMFAGYEWCVTDRFEPDDPIHKKLRFSIEQGNSLPELAYTWEVDEALQKAGFTLLESSDRARACDPETPWYGPLAPSWTLQGLRQTPLGTLAVHAAVTALERLGVAPAGSAKVSSFLRQAADDLVRAGRRGIFTPSWFFVARKPD
jgi:sterol 24-C-methyltransferase